MNNLASALIVALVISVVTLSINTGVLYNDRQELESVIQKQFNASQEVLKENERLKLELIEKDLQLEMILRTHLPILEEFEKIINMSMPITIKADKKKRIINE